MEDCSYPDRSNTYSDIAPELRCNFLSDSFHRNGNSLYRGERILVNKWSYGLRLPFISLWGYHRWGDKPVRKDDILVFNNPANLSQTAIDQREVYIGRCLGVPGDTLWVDSLFSVIPSEKNAPRPEVPLYISPEEREAVRLTAHYPFYPPQRIIGTGYGKKTYAASAGTSIICWNRL